MSDVRKLLKVQLMGFFGINKALHSKDPKEKRKLTLILVMMVFAILLICGTVFAYSFLMAEAFEEVGKLELLPALTMATSCVITLITTVYKINGVLFNYKDFDITMSLPVKTSTVVESRIMMLYIMNLVFSLVILIPSMMMYAIKANPEPNFYLLFVLLLFFIPMIPIIIASVIGGIISVVASRFKRKNIISLILTIVFFVVIMMVSLNMNSVMMDFANIGETIMNAVNRFYPLTKMYVEALCNQNVGALCLFIGISLLAFSLFMTLVEKWYNKLNTMMSTTRAQANYKMTALKESSPFSALYWKELRRYFSSPLYVMNTAAAAIMITLASIALLVLGSEQLAVLLEEPQLAVILHKFAPFVIALGLVLCSTTSCSISLEGKSLWIVKSAPVSVWTIFKSKIAVNIMVFLPVSLLNSILISIALKASLFDTLMIFLTPIVYLVFSALFGLAVNLKFPNLDWISESTVIKQSAATFISVIAGMVSTILPIALAFMLPVDANFITIGFTALIAAGAVLIYSHLKTKGTRVFNTLS